MTVDPTQPPRVKKKYRLLKTIGLVLLVALVAVGIKVGPALVVFYRHGLLTSDSEMRKYEGGRTDRLKALRTALLLYEDSEGAFPPAAKWMDAIENRLKAADMAQAEANQKLHDPAAPESTYGWAINSEVAGKYHGDIKDPDKTFLVFTSESTARNAAGNPEKDCAKPPRGGGNLGITVSGLVKRF